MKLKYRGIPYKYDPITVRFGGYFGEGKYRGVPAKYAIFTADVPSPEFELMYRGMTYHIGQPEITTSPSQGSVDVPETATAPEIPAAVKPLTMNERLRRLMMNHHRKVKQRQQAMLSRSDARVGLPTGEASRFWNHIQGKVHPSFGESYDRSSAALS